MAAKIQGNAMKYDDMDEFTPQELQLIMRHNHIYNNQDAPMCACKRYHSPVGLISHGPCLRCCEDGLKLHKPTSLKHLLPLWPADAETIQLAHELIEKHHKKVSGAAVAYLFKTKHTETNGKIKLGSCARQSPKNKLLHGWDFIIELAFDMFALLDDRQREALLLHEIKHIKKAGEDWAIEPHSVEEHVAVIEAYGLWMPDLEAFAAAIRAAEEDPNQKQLFEG